MYDEVTDHDGSQTRANCRRLSGSFVRIYCLGSAKIDFEKKHGSH
jgi:hypothetical protein